ncbi:RINT1-like protein MAG2 [Chenopodium quinoa]|uniref:RINT1-like protein MAG2 n=1 Tax=Chenopodium quinoa TaxID=63459 RepID=A0A803LKL1_CHEQI|nr:RINT1-like protein MAG2 [Chenopodium quinoa]
MQSKKRKTPANLPMDSSPETLPAITSLSPPVVSFLNSTFPPTHNLNLSESTNLVTELDTHCSELTHHLTDLTRRLDASLLSYASSSHRISDAFHHVHRQLQDLKSKSSSFASASDGEAEDMAVDELPALAKEVARVATVRNYAETALKLDSLVGDIEDAVTSVMNRNLKKQSTRQHSEEIRVNAINSLKSVDDILASVTREHPQWVRIVSAADHRVDRALAILRPQAIADYRALLVSIGWPPPLSTLSSSNTERRTVEESNPLSAMPGELKQKYCENFLALCSLQELQRKRKSRQLEGYNHNTSMYQPLWGIEELVNPLSLASLHHFQKWVDKPEYIFALVYKNTRDYIDSVDGLLQPLVDEAMLTGYSCREEWISGMVTSLSTYLAKEIFPAYVSRLDEETTVEVRPQGRMSWLHLVDLMIAFDKKIQALAALSGIFDSEEYSLLQRMSSLSVFCDRPDWLDLWAQIELDNILEKLKPEMEDERNWTTKTRGAVLFPGSDVYKSPVASSVVLQHVSSVIDRCRSIPSVFLRSRFVRLVGAPIIQTFLNCLLTKCQEAEGLTALADDDAVARVMTAVNSAHHLESILVEWCDDIIFVEMGLADDNESGNGFGESSLSTGVTEGNENGVLDEEITRLEEFRKEWIDKMTNVVLRGFDAQIRDYIKNKKQWQEMIEEGWTVTRSFVVALDFLQGKISRLEEGLNNMDFITVWRSLASGIDRLIFNGILMSNTKFYSGGVERFGGDMDVLYGVFRSWCLRPEGFFPRVSEGLKLLKLEENTLQELFIQGEGWMKHHGIRHMSIAEAEKIARCRIFK